MFLRGDKSGFSFQRFFNDSSDMKDEKGNGNAQNNSVKKEPQTKIHFDTKP